jgi:hypothetical protein
MCGTGLRRANRIPYSLWYDRSARPERQGGGVTPRSLCLCGCRLPITKPTYPYRRGHRPTGTPKSRPLCRCGCGKPVLRHRAIYRRGHRPKHIRFVPIKHAVKPKAVERKAREPKAAALVRECACGCGEPVKGIAMKIFLPGHNSHRVAVRKVDGPIVVVMKPRSGSRARRIWLEAKLTGGI